MEWGLLWNSHLQWDFRCSKRTQRHGQTSLWLSYPSPARVLNKQMEYGESQREENHTTNYTVARVIQNEYITLPHSYRVSQLGRGLNYPSSRVLNKQMVYGESQRKEYYTTNYKVARVIQKECRPLPHSYMVSQLKPELNYPPSALFRTNRWSMERDREKRTTLLTT